MDDTQTKEGSSITISNSVNWPQNLLPASLIPNIQQDAIPV